MKKVKLIMQKFLEENYIKYIKMPKNIIIFNKYEYFDKKIMRIQTFQIQINFFWNNILF